MKTRYFITICLVTSLICGCSGTKVTSYDGANETEGIVAYQPEMYLWITTDSSGKNLTYKFIPLPNKNKKIVISPKRGLGSGETSFKLSDGWLLTEFGSKSDSKIPETITAMTGLIAPIVGKDDKAAAAQPRPGLYKIQYDTNGLITGFLRIANSPLP